MSGSFRIEERRRPATPGVFHHPRSKAEAHDHVVFHLKTAEGGGPRRLQRSAAFRLHAVRPRRRSMALDAHPCLRASAWSRPATRSTGRCSTASSWGGAPAQGSTSRPAADRRSRQYLCLRGAVALRPVAAPKGRHHRLGSRPATRAPRLAVRHPPPSPRRSRPADRRCATMSTPTARWAISSIPSSVYGREGEPCVKPGCAGTCRASCSPAAPLSIARPASVSYAACRATACPHPRRGNAWPMKRYSSKRGARSASSR
jgi:formamidopyrimidine-DNA glycosylase